MNAGVIAKIDGSLNGLTTSQFDDDGNSVIEVGRFTQTKAGNRVVVGAAARERNLEDTGYTIRGTEIEEVSDEGTITEYTEFLTVPGEFVVVSSGDGSFAFDLIGRVGEADIERATIDLDGYIGSVESAEAWKVGFYDHDGQADNGVVYGDDILGDGEFGGVVDQARLNQLGVTYESQSGETVKLDITESGYLNVYSPGFDSLEFADFIAGSIAPFIELS
ncbi:hypothetical protein [Haloarchaeobius litoreus]|uniref:Uncharacterized protein n=1 Tax=Haloarchaeobius litoreus TaxID=755306 RepID=A0ABD6DME6_9EURY|nr:hypothetical protein [Haloarchaeobius litoreus]